MLINHLFKDTNLTLLSSSHRLQRHTLIRTELASTLAQRAKAAREHDATCCQALQHSQGSAGLLSHKEADSYPLAVSSYRKDVSHTVTLDRKP